jgi:hypothetical protein
MYDLCSVLAATDAPTLSGSRSDGQALPMRVAEDFA